MRYEPIEGGIAQVSPELAAAGVRLIKVDQPDTIPPLNPDVATQKQAAGGKAAKRAVRSQATVLIEIATGDRVDLFHSPDGTGYADIHVNGHRETWPLKSRGFSRWLRRAYYERTGGAPNGEAIATAMGVIEARAQFDGLKRPVYLRVAAHGGLIYIDLGDDDWRAIEVDSDGWRIVSAPPARFRRTPAMLALP